jgi:hypothetical protein
MMVCDEIERAVSRARARRQYVIVRARTTMMGRDGYYGYGYMHYYFLFVVFVDDDDDGGGAKAEAGRTRRATSSRCARATSRASASAALGHSGNVHTAWMRYAMEYSANAMRA